QGEEGIRDWSVAGVQTCALPIYSSISTNTAGGDGAGGGGFYSQSAVNGIKITGCTISDNTAGEEGGGFYAESPGDVTIAGSTIRSEEGRGGEEGRRRERARA